MAGELGSAMVLTGLLLRPLNARHRRRGDDGEPLSRASIVLERLTRLTATQT